MPRDARLSHTQPMQVVSRLPCIVDNVIYHDYKRIKLFLVMIDKSQQIEEHSQTLLQASEKSSYIKSYTRHTLSNCDRPRNGDRSSRNWRPIFFLEHHLP